jgi:deoxyhypusine synthase
MKSIKQMELHRRMTIKELVNEMRLCGVLGAGRIGRATDLLAKMFRDPDCTVFLTLAGALVPGGLRKIIQTLIDLGYVDIVVTTGANIVHDMLEAIGHKHIKGSFRVEDKKLKDMNIGRIGDIYVKQAAFSALESWLRGILNRLSKEDRNHLSIVSLLHDIGNSIDDPNSILASAAKRKVPIICPAFLDSIAGFHLWMFNQEEEIGLNPFLDLDRMMDKTLEAKRVGMIILGGGFPKHFALFANTFREGVEYAVQITMDRPEPGGLSGASLEEAISWSKVKPEGRTETVICDVTIAFPLMVAAALEEIQIKDNNRQ